MLARELRSREREHVQAMRARPFQEVFDEGEERLVGPLQILEYEHHRLLLRQCQDPRNQQLDGLATLHLRAVGTHLVVLRQREPEQRHEQRHGLVFVRANPIEATLQPLQLLLR